MASCKSCGIEIPDGQDFCSMCYGDPFYGNDGYYLAMLEQQAKEDSERREEENEQYGNLHR